MFEQGDKIIGQAGEKWDQSIMRVNTKRFILLRNIRNNIRRGLPQLAPYPHNPARVALVCGGWSLKDTFEELRQLYFEGVKLVAVNGSANWLMERNMRPSMHVMLDARPENAEFVRTPIPGCKYFFASQVDPSILDICADRDVTLFHGVTTDATLEIKRLDDFYMRRWVRLPTAGTVGVTTIMLLRILGFSHQHIFGLDSCNDPRDGAHHGYDQALNDGDGSAAFVHAGLGKEFSCSAWQAAQFQSFLNVIQVNGEALDLTVHGDGMIAYAMSKGCDAMEMGVRDVSPSV